MDQLEYIDVLYKFRMAVPWIDHELSELWWRISATKRGVQKRVREQEDLDARRV
jgi:hypothetical protein